MMKDLKDLIRERRLEIGKTLEQVGREIGVAKATVQRWESGEIKDMRRDKLVSLARALDTTPAYLMGWEPNVEPATARSSVSVSINVYGTVPAGVPVEAIEDIVDTEAIPKEWCRGGKEYFGLRVKGDSMYPKYLDGDTIIVRKQETCESGVDAVVYVNGYEATLKKVKIGDDGSLTLIPQNTNYAPITYTALQVAALPIKIAGVVVELRRKIS